MKNERAFHSRLCDAIRLCFPMPVRDSFEISPITVWRDAEPPKTIVRIIFEEDVPYHDHEALMRLIGAVEELTDTRQSVTLRGRYAGQACEIQLVTAEPLVC